MKQNVVNRLVAVICTIVLLHANIAFGSSSGTSASKKSSSYGNSSSGKSTGSPSGKSYGNSTRSSASSSGSPSTPSKYGNSSRSHESERKNEKVSGKYGNTAGKSAKSPTSSGGIPFGYSIDKGFAKENAKESLNRYKSERSRSRTSEGVGSESGVGYGNSSGTGRTAYSPDTYSERRGTFYRSSGYSPPIYIDRSYQRFGMWDAIFLWFMLDNITKPHYAQMYHHHQNDPGFRQWREEAEKLSAENKELKQKLATLDQEVAKLKGQPIDPSYTPPGIDADLLMHKDALDDLQKGKSGKGFSVWKLLFWIMLLAVIAYIVWKLLRAKTKTPSQKFRLD